MKLMLRFIPSLLFLVQVSAGAPCPGSAWPSVLQVSAIDSLDSVYFDLRRAVCFGPYISVPVHIKSDDEVYAIDFAVKLNVGQLTYQSIQQVKSYLFPSANYNAGDSTLRFTSFSLVPIENDSDLFWVRFNKTPDFISILDFTNGSAQLNGDFCAYTITSNGPEPGLSVPPVLDILQGDTVQVFVTAGSGAAFLWSTGSTAASIFVNTPGTYEVTVVSPGSGCAGVLSFDVNFALPLPVTFGSLTAMRQREDAVILWSTFTESGNDYFVVERSVDGWDWLEVGSVDGAGNSLVPRFYSFTDRDVSMRGVYYSIRQIDFNGVSTRSSLVYLPAKEASVAPVVLFPNPSTHFCYLRNTAWAAPLQLELISTAGVLISQCKAVETSNGQFRVEWPMGLHTGLYYVRVYVADEEQILPVFIADGIN